MPRCVTFFIYPEFVLLGLTGPLDALSAAEVLSPGSYRLGVVSMKGGPVECSSGLRVFSEPVLASVADTFIVVGSLQPTMRTLGEDTIDFIRSASANARRSASVCTGAFLLARSGLLDGHRATTHWQYVPKLKAMYPAVQVEEDRIFVNDAGIWTSAGMTAGIDMTLALIEEDLGKEIARAVARMLVVYYRRPGGQCQYSSLLELDFLDSAQDLKCLALCTRASIGRPFYRAPFKRRPPQCSPVQSRIRHVDRPDTRESDRTPARGSRAFEGGGWSRDVRRDRADDRISEPRADATELPARSGPHAARSASPLSFPRGARTSRGRT